MQQLTPEVECESVRNNRTFKAFTGAQSHSYSSFLHLQDIPAHLNTPRHSGSTMATPQHPLSTSAPSQYAQLTPLAPLHTPVEMILSSRKYTPVQAPGEVDS